MPRRRALGLLAAGLLGFGLSPKRALAGGNVNSNLRYQLKDTPCTDDMCSRGKICGVFSLPNKWGQKGCIKLGCCQGDQFCCASEATAHGASGGCCSKGFSCDNGKCVCYGKLSFNTGSASASASFMFASQQGPICICPPAQVCGSDCCKGGDPCIHNKCCPNNRSCGSGCCEENERCVHNEISSASSSSSSGCCCKEGERCIDGKCACPPEGVCGSGCCKQGDKCIDGECCKPEFQDAKDEAYRVLLAARAEAARVETEKIDDLEESYKNNTVKVDDDYMVELKKCENNKLDPNCALKAKGEHDRLVREGLAARDEGIKNAQLEEKKANEKAQANYDAAVKNARRLYCATP